MELATGACARLELAELTLASLHSPLATTSEEQIISGSAVTSRANQATRPPEPGDERPLVIYRLVYLQGGVFLYFESHGQLRCCLLHRHLGSVLFLLVVCVFPNQLGMAIVRSTAIW